MMCRRWASLRGCLGSFVPILVTAVWVLNGCASPGTSTQGSGQESAPAQLLEKGTQALRQRRYDQALERYERIESLYPYSHHALQAQLMVAYTHYLKGESLAAINAADRFMRLHPRNRHVDYALYLKGISHYRNIGEANREIVPARKAIETLSKLLRRYPDSSYAGDARKRIRQANRLVARHELHVAHYYFDRRAYVATINRCHTVLTNDVATYSREPALALMVQSYARLGLLDLAEDTLAILAHNYPESNYLGQARQAVERATPIGGSSS